MMSFPLSLKNKQIKPNHSLTDWMWNHFKYTSMFLHGKKIQFFLHVSVLVTHNLMPEDFIPLTMNTWNNLPVMANTLKF